MKNIQSRIFRTVIYGYILFAITNMLAGCASLPVDQGVPTYSLNGISYVPLVSLCNSRGIAWNYDVYSRTFTLTKGAHKINLRVGDSVVLVDGQPQSLRHPVDIYQGITVVPYRFKEQIVDSIFGGSSAPVTRARLGTFNIKKIVIDAGHGGMDPGAIGRTGLKEKDVNLDIAKRLANLMRNEGVDVVLTRSSDRFVSLPARVDITNRSHADLFLSIHSNANRSRSMNGFEVYYVGKDVNDSKRALDAARNAELNFGDSAFASSSTDLKATLWDMIYTYSRGESIDLASSICRTIENDSGVRILGVKGARYFVLKGARMPAVLIEVGFVSNTSEERKLRNGYYRQQIADGIMQGLSRYAQDYRIMEASR